MKTVPLTELTKRLSFQAIFLIGLFLAETPTFAFLIKSSSLPACTSCCSLAAERCGFLDHRYQRLSIVMFFSEQDDVALSNATAVTVSSKLATVSTPSSSALSLHAQAEALREEAACLEKTLRQEQENKELARVNKIDRWIDELLVNCNVNDQIQMLNTVDQVMERLVEDRFSQEQVNAIFSRICETGPPQSRSNKSPLMCLFLDAVGKLDDVEREDNPNKRWSGRVETILQKRLFAMDWGIELDEEGKTLDK